MELGRWELDDLAVPLVGTAVHAGHALRPDVAAEMVLGEHDRLREEDPFTERFADLMPNRFVAHRSRFELDLNRPRHKAVYREPQDAWGLALWRDTPPAALIEKSLRLYDTFYDEFGRILRDMEGRHGSFLVLDMHSYNHRRDGPDAAPGDPADNPEVNVGTSDLDLARWGGLVDRFMSGLADRGGLDVRANVRFTGGHLIQWVQENFPHSGCALAIELKKTFMDEHSGALDEGALNALVDAVGGVLPSVRSELEAVHR